MTARHLSVLLLAALGLGAAACAAPSGGASNPPQVRCLSRPSPGSPDDPYARPLIFLFCTESP
jgi:hypothetical protein